MTAFVNGLEGEQKNWISTASSVSPVLPVELDKREYINGGTYRNLTESFRLSLFFRPDLASTSDGNVLIAGTQTNVCCEATARDAMMLDFNTVMLSDCTAALSDDEHRATLETFIQQFGDVLTGSQAVAIVEPS